MHAQCTEGDCVKATRLPTNGSLCTLGVHRKLHAPRIAEAAVIVPCRNARGGFVFALYVTIGGLIYWGRGEGKHCVAEMSFASWTAWR